MRPCDVSGDGRDVSRDAAINDAKKRADVSETRSQSSLRSLQQERMLRKLSKNRDSSMCVESQDDLLNFKKNEN
jgi:hypothetical protein